MKTRLLLLALAIATLASCRKEPVACFSTDPAENSTIYIGTEISFDNCSTDDKNSVWNFGDGTISSERNPVHTYDSAGTYTVTLTAFSKGDMKKDVATLVLAIDTFPLLTYGLVAYYPFNGNADDESANKFHGDVDGATLTADRFGNPNSAYCFDGFYDNIEIDEVAKTLEKAHEYITLAAWIQLAPYYEGENYGAIICISSNSTGLYVGDDESGTSADNKLTVYDGGSPSYSFEGETDIEVADHSWHHVAYVRDGSQGTLYVDGLERSTHQADFSLRSYEKGAIGNKANSSRDGIDGIIDEVRIYNIALSASEILELYQE